MFPFWTSSKFSAWIPIHNPIWVLKQIIQFDSEISYSVCFIFLWCKHCDCLEIYFHRTQDPVLFFRQTCWKVPWMICWSIMDYGHSYKQLFDMRYYNMIWVIGNMFIIERYVYIVFCVMFYFVFVLYLVCSMLSLSGLYILECPFDFLWHACFDRTY
jgi:hypothetical protein